MWPALGLGQLLTENQPLQGSCSWPCMSLSLHVCAVWQQQGQAPAMQHDCTHSQTTRQQDIKQQRQPGQWVVPTRQHLETLTSDLIDYNTVRDSAGAPHRQPQTLPRAKPLNYCKSSSI